MLRAAPLLLGVLLGACKRAPAPHRDDAPPVRSVAALPAPPSASSSPLPPPSVAIVAPEPFAPAKSHPTFLTPIDGALLVVEKERVGRIIGDDIDWFGKIPKERPGIGQHSISEAFGRWPELVEVFYSTDNGRAPIPTYFPVKGKGNSFAVSEGGGLGILFGLAHVGETSLLAYQGYEGIFLWSARGPKLPHRFQNTAEGGCKEGEVFPVPWIQHLPAIRPEAIGATRSGTLLSVGTLCEKRGPAAEIWDKSGKSRITTLSPWFSSFEFPAAILQGNDDDLWVFPGKGDLVLRFKDGAFSPLPHLGHDITNLFVSQEGQLHVHDGSTISRLEGTQWTPVARLAWPQKFDHMAAEKGTFWVSGAGVFRLRPSADTAFRDGCTTPLVHLYQVSEKNDRKYTFPSTRKALSSFAAVEQLGLIEFHEAGAYQLGIVVQNKDQGEALIQHINSTMKEEKPRLLCYSAKDPRRIELKKP